MLLLGLGTIRNVAKTVIETRNDFSSIVVKQAPFPAHNAEKVEINNFSSQLANPCWDAPLPCVLPWYNRNIEQRTASVEEGFRPGAINNNGLLSE